MYDELIESLRYEAAFAYLGSDGERLAGMMRKAADAIEELSREVEEYKAAYRKEHNKRIDVPESHQRRNDHGKENKII